MMRFDRCSADRIVSLLCTARKLRRRSVSFAVDRLELVRGVCIESDITAHDSLTRRSATSKTQRLARSSVLGDVGRGCRATLGDLACDGDQGCRIPRAR